MRCTQTLPIFLLIFSFLAGIATPAFANERFAGLVIVGGGYALSSTVSNVVLLRSDTATHEVNFTYPIYDRDVLNKVTPGFSVQDGFVSKVGQESSSVAYSYTKPLIGPAFTDTKAELEFKVNHKLPTPYSGILFRPSYDLRHIIGGSSSGFFPSSGSVLLADEVLVFMGRLISPLFYRRLVC